MIAVKDDVIRRLESFGYTVEPGDAWVLEFLIDKVTNYIKSACNTGSVPDGLRQIAVDMVCGELLRMKKGTGGLSGFDVEDAISSIREGDTTWSFATNKTITLDGLIDLLANPDPAIFAAFRRLVW